MKFPMRTALLAILALLCLVPASCRREAQTLPQDPRTQRVDEAVRARWGKGLAELEAVDLVVITANNENIQDEFRWAFSLWHAQRYGQRVNFLWRDVGGGGTSIENYLLNVYGGGGNPGVDILWGGGDMPFKKLAKGLKETGPLLEVLDAGVLADMPEQISGVPMCDISAKRLADGTQPRRWIGSAVSGFGILYNEGMLRRCGIEPPRDWDDLGDKRFAGLVEMADPTQSGSAASAYRMIVQSGMSAPDGADPWPAGWAKLLGLLSNVHRFSDSAGSAANAPLLGESLVATCIDFYGAMRVFEAPDQLRYISPRGQTTFTPDPIGILKGAPHPELAQRFVQFVLSPQGQALWALPVGHAEGPVRRALGRQPIRRDVYRKYAGQMLPWIIDPYEAGNSVEITKEKDRLDFGVLRELVGAAIASREEMAAAKRKLIKTNFPPALVARLNRLPDNVNSLAKIEALAKTFAKEDKKEYDAVTRGWRDYFREQFQAVARGEGEESHP